MRSVSLAVLLATSSMLSWASINMARRRGRSSFSLLYLVPAVGGLIPPALHGQWWPIRMSRATGDCPATCVEKVSPTRVVPAARKRIQSTQGERALKTGFHSHSWTGEFHDEGSPDGVAALKRGSIAGSDSGCCLTLAGLLVAAVELIFEVPTMMLQPVLEVLLPH